MPPELDGDGKVQDEDVLEQAPTLKMTYKEFYDHIGDLDDQSQYAFRHDSDGSVSSSSASKKDSDSGSSEDDNPKVLCAYYIGGGVATTPHMCT